MEELVQMNCVACRKDAPQVTEEEIVEFLPQVPEWKLVERESIKQARQHLGLTQKQLAQALGVTLATVGRWECGLRNPSPLAVRTIELLVEVERLKRQPGEEKE